MYTLAVPPIVPSPALTPAAVAAPLLGWFDEHGRTLPWRGCGDPYRIWVSEIMLQQTRVETVRRYYPRFIEALPTVRALAAADLDDVLALWSGLGFYRRARALHAAAQQVVGHHAGQLPRDRAALLALPGVGRYTVGAILSAAWDDPEPVLDGNVVRVLSRLFVVEGDPKAAAAQRRLWALATDVLPPVRAGDFNQALMDLGATICKPTGPTCPECPLAHRCGARRAGRAEELPQPSRRARVIEVERVAVRVRDPQGRLLLTRRPPQGLLAHLWEPPATDLAPGERPEQALARLAELLGLASPLRFVDAVEHRFSHRLWRVRVYDAEPEGAADHAAERGEAPWVGLRWFTPPELDDVGVPTVSRKILEL